MIDTLTLTTKDFELDILENQASLYPFTRIRDYNANPLEQVDINNLLMYDRNKKAIYGNGLTLARNVDNPKGLIKDTMIIKISLFNAIPYLSVQCSVPKFLYNGCNFYLATYSDIQKYKQDLTLELSKIGIYTNVDTMTVSRLDLTKNIETVYKFPYYIPLLKILNASKQVSSEINASTYMTGSGKGKTRVICCYDKIQELQNNEEALPFGFTVDSNVFRCEYRLLKKEAIKSIDINSFSELLENYELTKMAYREGVKSLLLRNYDSGKLESQKAYDLESIAFAAMEKSPRNWISEFIKDFGIYASEEAYTKLLDNLDIVLEVESEKCKREGKNSSYIRTTKYRHRQALQKEIQGRLLTLENRNNVSYKQLFEELSEKLTA